MFMNRSLPRRTLLVLALALLGLHTSRSFAQRPTAPRFAIEDILSLPQPDNLVASPTGSTVAWTFNEGGARNVYVADAPAFMARRLTDNTKDDGQELTQLSFSSNGRTLVYVRGGDHGSNRNADPPNPAGSPIEPAMQVWSVPVAGGVARRLADGDEPQIAPDNARVAFVHNHRIWIARLDGSTKPEAAFFARGAADSPRWSRDGRTLAFVLDRGDHSFIGLFSPGQPVRYVAPSTSRDSMPIWSPDGTKLAFLRQPGTGGTPRSPLIEREEPWAIMVAGAATSAGDRELPARVVRTSGQPVDRILRDPSGIGLRWAASDRLVFLSYRDGFPHLYSISVAPGSEPLLLTPGSFRVESVALAPDRRAIVYSANAGPDRSDFDRRHLFTTPIDAAAPRPLTSGAGIEWNPVVTADGGTVVFLSADARRPPLPAWVPLSGGSPQSIAQQHLPPAFPVNALVVPEPIAFAASDGVTAHGQLFIPATANGRRAAIVYVHGGGPRQMLLGWHTRWEYANDYAINQYLVSRGFLVLSVDYRLSVGYGEAFQFAPRTGPRGASEYLDVLAAGLYLRNRPDVDPKRIGIWGASYGGYLTALALARNSDVFAAGVDIHGVEDRTTSVSPAQLARALVGDGLTEMDLRQALAVAFQSSPVSAMNGWRSPVLLIHGDDDHTVEFHQTVDLSRRLGEHGVHVEELVLPDEVHDALRWRDWTKTASATTEFFERILKATD
jgi:dipeptidyl aminopeptidase/acylaminoacyl peptidase